MRRPRSQEQQEKVLKLEAALKKFKKNSIEHMVAEGKLEQYKASLLTSEEGREGSGRSTRAEERESGWGSPTRNAR